MPAKRKAVAPKSKQGAGKKQQMPPPAKKSKVETSGVHLKYWGGRGLMEIPRVMYAISGKFPGEGYEDGRFSAPPEGLEANLGRMPVLAVGDDSVGQSVAINYYVATECGLMGDSTLEAAKILAIGEHLKECRAAYQGLVPYGTVPTAEALDKWFDGGAKDTSGPADMATRATRYLPWYMARIEAILGDAGHAVGTKLSLADVLIHNMFAEFVKDEECGPTFKDFNKGAFSDKARTDAAVAKFPKLAACCEAVASNENVKKWLSIRGEQGF